MLLFRRRAKEIDNLTKPAILVSMRVIHSDESLEFEGHSVFLAGPTPRKMGVLSWRIEALKMIERSGYKGTILVPERTDWAVKFDYADQVEWEEEGLRRADVIVFWVPRSLPDMPAFTTNVEFGRWIEKKPGQIVYGRPNDAIHCRYLDWLFMKKRLSLPWDTLENTINAAIN